ncbi:MAG: hypothetical protein FRX49_01393 [Trebouxia sp. A1-2]|nr:MAG: hypothetical protein FRX49_01393 [Trebouxia sp. A1-2]
MTGTALLQSPSSTKLCGVHTRSRLFRPFRKHHSRPRRDSNLRTAHRCKASTEAQMDDRSEIQIEGIEQNYCDDFVCTSSPAVEQNLRALARDVVRTSTWTSDLFADEVRYKDKFRSTEGIAQYKRQTYLAGAVKAPKVLVTKLRMISRDVGAVNYRMRGSIASVPVDIDFEDVFELNLLTGRVLKHTETWDLSRCSLPGKAAFIASRIIWATRQASITSQASDTKDGGSKIMQSFSSLDEGDQQGFTQNPSDPTRFFQPQDNGNKDLIQVALVIAVLYLIYNTYSQIEGIK